MDIPKEVAGVYNRREMVAYHADLTAQGLSEAEQKLITQYLTSAGKILVIGCGTGREIFALRPQGFELVGLDLAWEMLRQAHETRLRLQDQAVPLHQGDAVHLPYRDASFAHVLMISQTIQHIPQRQRRQQALREMYRVVKPGGCCLLSAFNQPISFWYLFLLGRQQQSLFHAQKPVTTPFFNTLPSWVPRSDAANWASRLLGRIIRKIYWELYPPIRSYAEPLPLTTRTLFFCWRTLTNWQRRARSKLSRDAASLLEPNDMRFDFPDFRFHLCMGKGNLFMHFPDMREMLADLTAAGFELRACRSAVELERGQVFSEKLRNSQRLLFYVAQKR